MAIVNFSSFLLGLVPISWRLESWAHLQHSVSYSASQFTSMSSLFEVPLHSVPPPISSAAVLHRLRDVAGHSEDSFAVAVC